MFEIYAQNYQTIINPYVAIWKEKCLNDLSLDHITIIAHTMIASYKIVQSSLIMSQARLKLQLELLNIIILSMNDSLDIGIQIQNNDFNEMKHIINTMEQTQEEIKVACINIEKAIPLLINIDPKAIQMLIANFKSIILHWVKTQDETISDLDKIKEEFISSTQLFSHVKNIYQTIINNPLIEHNHLLQGADIIIGMYKKIEDNIALLTITRQEGISELSILLTLFFQLHYQALYQYVEEKHNALHNLTKPDCIF